MRKFNGFSEICRRFSSNDLRYVSENLGNGKWGKIRIVAGNKAYIDSIENMSDMPKAFSKKIIPNSEYQNYIPQDPNFEFFCYSSAVLKKLQHSYVHPDRFDFWFNLFSLPIDFEDGNLCYCTYTQELTREPDSEKMSNVSHDIAAEVLNTCIKLRDGLQKIFMKSLKPGTMLLVEVIV